MTTNAQVPTKVYYEDMHVGYTLPSLVKPPITHLQLVRYAGASGDFNPLHTDAQVGEKLGFGGVIAHGMLIMGFTGQMLSDFIGPEVLRSLDVRFKGMTHLGDIITCTGVITEIDDAKGKGRISGTVQATDQTGNVKLTGTFTAVLPKRN